MHDRAVPQIARRRSEAGVGEGQAETPVSGCCEAATLGHSELTKSPEIHPLFGWSENIRRNKKIRAKSLTNPKSKIKCTVGPFFISRFSQWINNQEKEEEEKRLHPTTKVKTKISDWRGKTTYATKNLGLSISQARSR